MSDRRTGGSPNINDILDMLSKEYDNTYSSKKRDDGLVFEEQQRQRSAQSSANAHSSANVNAQAAPHASYQPSVAPDSARVNASRRYDTPAGEEVPR